MSDFTGKSQLVRPRYEERWNASLLQSITSIPSRMEHWRENHGRKENVQPCPPTRRRSNKSRLPHLHTRSTDLLRREKRGCTVYALHTMVYAMHTEVSAVVTDVCVPYNTSPCPVLPFCGRFSAWSLSSRKPGMVTATKDNGGRFVRFRCNCFR